ncbi:MAG: hypothetical protein ACRD98_09090, partial [Nitrososphaera sp.]
MLKGSQRDASPHPSRGDDLRAVRRKGKHASSTENRRMVWENVVWPLVLEVNRSYFALREY